jgi:flavin-dependent dehydrogenase
MPSSLPTAVDVLVAGAGPAGTTVSGLLAQLGYQVLVIEQQRFPRYHIGESLTPAVEPLFEFLGIGDRMASAEFVRMPGHTFRWNGSERTSYFGVDQGGDVLGYQVWRARFDRLLLERARELGAEVRLGVMALGPLTESDGRVAGLRLIGPDRVERTVRARLTIDATGMRGLLARRLRIRTGDPAPPALAIWGYWRSAGDPPGRDAHNTYVESFADGWIWTVRVRPELRNVTVMVDPEQARPELRRLGLAGFYRQQIAATVATRQFLAEAQLATRLWTCDGRWYRGKAAGGPGFLVIGDAASYVDPLTSQGVRKALSSGMHAAVVANTLIREPALTPVALAFGQAEEERSYRVFRDAAVRSLIAEERWRDRPFWRRRTTAVLGEPAPDPPPPRRGVLREAVRQAPLARLRLHWPAGARHEQQPVVVRNILRLRPAVVTQAVPAGIGAPDLDLEQLFPLVAARKPLPEVVDGYLALSGRGREARAEVLVALERLVDDGACDVVIEGQ